MTKTKPVNSSVPNGRVPYSALVGRAIELERKRRGLTQAQMAALLGLGQSGYSRLESGQATINVSQLQKVASELGLPAADLLKTADLWKRNLQDQGVAVTDAKEDSKAALIIGLAILAAIAMR